jgi:hypothetical protein
MSTSKDHPRSRSEPGGGSPMTEQSSTPPEIAKRYRVSSDTVRGWIVSGQLRAVDVSARPGIGRPRWRIHPCDLVAFENARTAQPPVKPARRRRKAANVVEYF